MRNEPKVSSSTKKKGGVKRKGRKKKNQVYFPIGCDFL
jgi:hypothetical protein